MPNWYNAGRWRSHEGRRALAREPCPAWLAGYAQRASLAPPPAGVIDELTGQEEIVVKQYDAVREGLPFFGGATLLSDGSPSLIVDVSSLL